MHMNDEVPSLDNPADDTTLMEPGESPVTDDAREEVVLTSDETKIVEDALFIGRREKIVNVFDHEVYIKTLTVDEELRLALLIKDWEETRGFVRAFKTAVVAASVREIDGKPLYTALGPHEENDLTKKFSKVKQFYPVFVDKVYAAINEMEEQMGRELSEKLGK